MKGRLFGPTRMRELRNEPFSDVASIGTGARPLPYAGNPVAGWNPAGAAAIPVPAQRTRAREYRVADRTCRPDHSCEPAPTSDPRAAIVLLPAPPGPVTTRRDLEPGSPPPSIHRGTCMKTDSGARSEWYPSPQRTFDGFNDGGLIGTSALADAAGSRRRSQAEKQPRRTLRAARRYSASPARVFDAWLDPAVARQWLFATASHPLAYIEIDARVKGSFCFVDPQDAVDGTRYTGEYLEITPPQRLVFTLCVAKFVDTRVTVVIAPLAKG